jgi:hypothetical protein
MAKARNFSIIAVLTAVFCSLIAVVAQEKQSGKGVEAGYSAPKPGLEMEKISFQVGDWKVVEKHEPAQGFSGGDGRGTVKTRRGPGGLSIETDYNSVGPMGDFAGKGIILWDVEEKVYKSYWFDNWQAVAFVTVGKWEGKDLIFVGEIRKTPIRQVYTDITPTSYTCKLYLGESSESKLAFTFKAAKK